MRASTEALPGVQASSQDDGFPPSRITFSLRPVKQECHLGALRVDSLSPGRGWRMEVYRTKRGARPLPAWPTPNPRSKAGCRCTRMLPWNVNMSGKALEIHLPGAGGETSTGLQSSALQTLRPESLAQTHLTPQVCGGLFCFLSSKPHRGK